MSNQDHAYALPSGFMLEEYQIERVLGSGGFGITYYAWDRHLDKAVAIKEYLPNEFAVRYEDTTVAPKSSSDAETYEWGLTRFLEEARILAGFDHPNINRVYRRLEAHGTAYMVLEYLPGESLSARLKRTGRLSPEEVWRLFNELLSGLSEVHRQDYVHRDIKPGNIMFREDGGAVLLDFGAARQAVGQRSRSITAILTPFYAPPEQYDLKGDDVGPWSDFYALGVVAYRCVTGVAEGALLEGPKRDRLAARGKGEEDLRPVVELAKGQYDQRLLEAIDWCMRVDERKRPQGAADLEEMLADGASKEKKKPKPAPKPKPESKPKHPAIWVVVGAWAWWLVIALLLGLGAWQWFSPSPPAPPPLADDPGEASAPAVVPAPPPPRVAAEPGSLMLELSPEDAQVMLPDIESSYRPGLALPAGEYRVVVRREGYETFEDTLRIEAGQRTTRAITLVEELGSLMLEIEPRDARVILPDIGPRYRPGLALPAGEYRVVVRQVGYEEFEGTVRIEAGQRTTRAITLRRTEPERAVGEVFRDTLKSGGEGPEMVVLPTGSFRMGDLNGDGYIYEKPVRRVTISRSIAMGKYEVTFAEYDRFARATGRALPSDYGWSRGNRPVVNVNQEEAKAYAVWLSEQTGKRYRLPSEAEWEYAARAGTTTKYSWGDEIGGNRANCDGCGSEWDNEKTAPVGSFAANAFGLHDLHGNVWEWVEDCWHDNYKGAPTDGRAWTMGCSVDSDGDSSAVLRGGSWINSPRFLRSAFRIRYRPSVRYNAFGFRLVQDSNP